MSLEIAQHGQLQVLLTEVASGFKVLHFRICRYEGFRNLCLCLFTSVMSAAKVTEWSVPKDVWCFLETENNKIGPE